MLKSERHLIKKHNPFWYSCDELCFKSKNLYNYANYIIRQRFIANKGIPKCNELDKMLQNEECYKELGSQSAQRLIKLLCKDWKSFIQALQKFNRNPNTMLGRPRMPNYKKKDGRYICELKNIQFKVLDNYIYFSLKKLKVFNNSIKTNVNSKVMGARIIPKGGCYILEIVYEVKEQKLKTDNNRYLSIDLGVNNFVTMVNNIGETPIVINGKGIKSYNKYWNKQVAKYRAFVKTNNGRDWSNNLERLYLQRYNKFEYYMHKISKNIVEYCEVNNINTIVIGKNKEWKQESKLNKNANQSFIQIPYENLISKLQYKCELVGINVVITEESYTSGTSFLDNEMPIKENYNKSRRVYRGLFKSNSGVLINADVNGAYQIMKKVFPNAFANGVVGVGLHPVIVNIIQ